MNLLTGSRRHNAGATPDRSPPPRPPCGPRIRHDRGMATRLINGRRAVDRAGAADAASVSVPQVDKLYRERARTRFPERIPGTTCWYEDDILAWKPVHQESRTAALTTVDRSGDPDELVIAAEIARILGYRDRTSLSNSSVWPRLLELNKPEDNQILPSGRPRRRWPRRVVWQVGDARTGKSGPQSGRPVGTPRSGPVDRTGDPEELVGAPETARTLGYSKAESLPQAVLDRADEVTTDKAGRQHRKWRRRTLWTIADELLADLS